MDLLSADITPHLKVNPFPGCRTKDLGCHTEDNLGAPGRGCKNSCVNLFMWLELVFFSELSTKLRDPPNFLDLQRHHRVKMKLEMRPIPTIMYITK